jgi:hypothetical protein
MEKNKLIGQVYVNVLQDEKGEIKYAWGYDLDYNELRLCDLATLNSQLQTWKDKAQQDYNERVEDSDKEFSVEKE